MDADGIARSYIAVSVRQTVRAERIGPRHERRDRAGGVERPVDGALDELWRLGSQYLRDRLVADVGFRLRAGRDPGASLRSICDRPRPGVRRGRAAQRFRGPDVSPELVRDQRAHEASAAWRMAVWIYRACDAMESHFRVASGHRHPDRVRRVVLGAGFSANRGQQLLWVSRSCVMDLRASRRKE